MPQSMFCSPETRRTWVPSTLPDASRLSCPRAPEGALRPLGAIGCLLHQPRLCRILVPETRAPRGRRGGSGRRGPAGGTPGSARGPPAVPEPGVAGGKAGRQAALCPPGRRELEARGEAAAALPAPRPPQGTEGPAGLGLGCGGRARRPPGPSAGSLARLRSRGGLRGPQLGSLARLRLRGGLGPPLGSLARCA